MHRTNYVLRAVTGVLMLGFVHGGLAGLQALRADDVAPLPRMIPEDEKPTGKTWLVPIGAVKTFSMQGKKIIKKVVNQREDVANVAAQDNNQSILIKGLIAGTTRLTLTAIDNEVETHDVLVELDVEFLKSILQRAVPTASLQLIPAGSGGGAGGLATLIIGGSVPHVEDINIVMKIAESVLGKNQAINAMRVGGVMQVQLDVVVAQVSRSEIRRMSFDFLNDGAHHTFASSPGGAITIPTSLTSVPGMPATLGNTIGTPNSAPANFFLGLFNSKQDLFSFLQLLKNESVAKLLAEPRLTTLSGKAAQFVSGGQQAVPSPGGLGAVSVSFVPFGTQLSVLPIVLGNGKIYLEVTPSISTLDAASGTTIAGTSVSGRLVQSVHTTVEMEDGQTFVLGGLIQTSIQGSASKVPVLGDLPFVGAAFRSEQFTEQETEVVILVTPHLVDPMSCSQLPKVLPGQETRSPDDFELFLEGILEAPRGQREVNHNNTYVPAYKNGPTANCMPCGNRNGSGSCGAGCATCSGSGLAEASTISYPVSVPAAGAKKAVEPNSNNKAQLLPPVEGNEASSDSGTVTIPAGEVKPASLPTLFGPASANR